MNEPVVLDEEKGIPVIDSRLLAEMLGIEHRALMRLMKDHVDAIGETTFQMSIPTGLGGRAEEYALLDEVQSTMTLMFTRNSEQTSTRSFWEDGEEDQAHWEITRAVLRYLIAHDSQLAAYLKKMGMKL